MKVKLLEDIEWGSWGKVSRPEDCSPEEEALIVRADSIGEKMVEEACPDGEIIVHFRGMLFALLPDQVEVLPE